MVFFATYVVLARLRWVRNVDRRIVGLGILSALASGVFSWLFLSSQFSSSNVFWVATVTAPIAFLGFCAIFILIGPANVDRSVAFSILIAFKAVDNKEMPEGKMIDIVPAARILNRRLRELSAYGLIDVSGNRIKVTKAGNRTLRFYLWLGRLLNVEPQ